MTLSRQDHYERLWDCLDEVIDPRDQVLRVDIFRAVLLATHEAFVEDALNSQGDAPEPQDSGGS